jgi:hypothetical protein
MKSVKEYFFWPVIVALVSGVVLFGIASFSQPRPQVVFTLPEPIEYAQESGQSQPALHIQQLVVTNVGGASAKSIVVKFKKPIAFPDVKKYSEADKPEVFLQNLPHEVRYPELPPQTGFKIVFSVPSGSIEPTDLIIKHSEGDAEEATIAAQPKSAQRVTNTLTWLLLAFQLFVLLSAVKTGLRDWRRDSLEDRLSDMLKYEPIKETFEKKKPWYMSKRDWFKAWVQITKQNMWELSRVHLNAEDLRKSSIYRLLDEERPDTIPMEQWREASTVAQDRLDQLVRYRLQYVYKPKNVLDLCSLARPRFFPEERWSDLAKAIAEETYKAFSGAMEYSIENAVNVLKQEKPECLSDALWQSITAKAVQNFKNNIERECRYSKKALTVIRSYGLDVLPEVEAKALRKSVTDEYVMNLLRELRVSKEPLKELSNLDLQGLSEEQVQDLRQSAYSAQKERSLPSLGDQAAVKKIVAAGKPDWLSNEDFARLNASALLYDELQKTIEQRLQVLETERAETERAKGKYQICLQVLQDFVLTGKVDDQYSYAFREEDWGRLKLIEHSWRHNSHSPSLEEQEEKEAHPKS